MVIHRFRRATASLSAVLVALGSANAFAHEHMTLPLEQIFGAETLWEEGAALTVSRDGRRVAYVTHQKPEDFDDGGDGRWRNNGAPRSTAGVRIFISNTDTQQSHQACANGGYSWGPAWSMDGKQLAFYSDAPGYPSLWIYDTASASCRQLAAEPVKLKFESGDEIQWLPDGSSVIVPLYPEGNSAQAVVAIDAAMRAPKVEGDLELYASGSELRDDPSRSDALGNPKSIESALDVQYRVSLAAVDVRTGAIRRLDSAIDDMQPAATARVSPSGRWLSVLSVPKLAPDGSGVRSNLLLIDIASGSTHTVAKDLSTLGPGFANVCYAWNPHKDALMYAQEGAVFVATVDRQGVSKRKRLGAALGHLDQHSCWFTADGNSAVVQIEPADAADANLRISLGLTAVAQLVFLPLDESSPTRIDLRAEPWEYESLIATRARVVWQPESNTVTLIGRDRRTGERLAVRFDIKQGTRRTIWRGRARLSNFDAGRDHGAVFAGYVDRSTPPNIFSFTSSFEPDKQISRIAPQLQGVASGDARIFSISVPQHDHSFKKVRTAVLLPPGIKPGDRPPAIVALYPGGDAASIVDEYGGGNLTGIPAQVFTDRGYAVVYPEIAVGPGGETGNVIDEMMDSLLPQIYAAAERGLIDSTRLAVHGNSFGGYAAAAIVTRTNLFRASIPANGIYDFVSYSYSGAPHGEIYWAEHMQPRLGASLWEQRSRYVDNSPLFQADKIKTPMLILQGGADWNRPQAEELYVAMQRLNKPAQLAIYEGGGHWPAGWRLKQAIAATERVLEFLARHLALKETTSDARAGSAASDRHMFGSTAEETGCSASSCGKRWR